MNNADASWPQYLAALAQAEKEKAYAIAFRVANNSATAEEAVQEAVLRLLRRPPKAVEEDAVRALFFTAVRRTALESARTVRRRRHYEGDYGSVFQNDARRSLEEPSVSDESTRILQAALAALPRKEREAIGLCYEMNFTQRQAAKVLGTSQKTVSNLLKSGLDKLRKTMTAQGVSAGVPATLIATLGSMPKPAVPINLGRFLDRFAADPTAAGFSAGKQTVGSVFSAKSMTATVWLPIVLSAALAATVGIIWRMNHSEPSPPADMTAAEAREDQPVEAKREYGVGDVSWSFSDGPPNDSWPVRLQILQGRWTWRKNPKTLRGEMVSLDEHGVAVVPDLKTGERPFEVKFILSRLDALGKTTLLEKKEWRSFFNVYWASPTGKIPYRGWSRPSLESDLKAESFVSRTIFYEKHAYQYVEGRLILVCEYDRPRPSERLCFFFQNSAVSKIEMRTLDEEEIPALMRDPEKAVQQYKLSPLPSR